MEDGWIHLCVDMQRMFAEDTPWHVGWMERVSPAVVELATRYPERTIFTRFIPPPHRTAARGMWRAYYEKWWMMTGEHLHAELVDILPELRRLVPPARVFDKPAYSPWVDGRLDAHLRIDGIQTLVVTGGETDVCVTAAIFGAIDLGYRVILLKDAVCSGADETHDASLKLFGDRFSVQLEIMETVAFLTSVR
ncbi:MULTISPECIES: isochorismatase family cysteine hydrolase [unclassified Rhizobium]|uniref:cysteine hydrolase family protein n=1 Tax=unclassified Rhizobium TaxID=2613769 RepID=UPI000BE7FC09|nr:MULTISPECIES: isochorismatase family cysteine hydrolase [unclassified Rhizobium]MDF0664051.1 cysteine hydrolase [Rhizobium sp. BC49]PDS79019.1 cysteine hydrolase [Rhizobium sp. L18]